MPSTPFCPGKVGTGFPNRTCANVTNLERIPIQPSRDALQPVDCLSSRHVDAEVPMRRTRGEPSELRTAHMNEGHVVAALQIDVRLFLNAIVDNDVQPI